MKEAGEGGRRAASPVYGGGCLACRDCGCFPFCEDCEGSGSPCFVPVQRSGAACTAVALAALLVFAAAAGWMLAMLARRWM